MKAARLDAASEEARGISARFLFACAPRGEASTARRLRPALDKPALALK